MFTPNIVKKMIITDLVITFINVVISERLLPNIDESPIRISDNNMPWIIPCLFCFRPKIKLKIAIKKYDSVFANINEVL